MAKRYADERSSRLPLVEDRTRTTEEVGGPTGGIRSPPFRFKSL
jgi:hypothetical protein